MKKGPNSTIFLVMIACAVVFGLGINMFAYSRLSSRRASLAKVKAEVETEKKVPLRLKASEEALQQTQDGLKHLEQNVSAQNYVPTLMRQLEDLGNSCGVEVIAVRPVPAPPQSLADKTKIQAPKPYDTMDIEIKGTAHYADALRFVNSLDTFPKIVEARSVSLEPVSKTAQKNEPGSPKLTLSILLRAFLFKSDDRTASTQGDTKHA